MKNWRGIFVIVIVLFLISTVSAIVETGWIRSNVSSNSADIPSGHENVVSSVTVNGITSGKVEPGWTGPNVCKNPGDFHSGFEDGIDTATVSSGNSGIRMGAPWVYSDVRTGNYNYPYYYSIGNFAIWTGAQGNWGMIVFTQRPSSYFSALISAEKGAAIDAYNKSGRLVASSGHSGKTTGTNTMARLTVEAPEIAYVIVHDGGNFWIMDEICTDQSVAPELQIIDAKMVSPNELGIGVDVTFPKDCPTTAKRFLTFNATINKKPVTKTIDVTAYTKPGVKWGKIPGVQNQMFDINGNLRPTTPLRINLAEAGVPRFNENINFDLRGVASYQGGSKSAPSFKKVRILLPVVLLHGYVTRFGEPFTFQTSIGDVKGYPGGHTSAKSGNLAPLRGLFNSIAYNGFSKYLEIKGYNSSKFWGTSTMKNYVTLWDPRDPDIGYSSLSYATPGNLDADFTRIYDLVKQYSYANKFNTIGHSTGGLAARYWAVKFGDKMNKIITVGTPHAGITEFYNEAFGGRYTSRADFIKKSLVLPDGSTANLIQWFVPEWDAVDESSIPDFPPEQTKSPYFSNTFNYGYNPAVKFYILYGSWNDPKWKENNKPAPWLSTPYSTKITWLNKNQIWYKISRMLYAEGDGYVFSGSASAGINGPANGPNFIRKGFDISYPHGVILNNPEIRTYISQNLMAS